MIRNNEPEYPKIKEIYPVFSWCKCDFCNNEFKREYGYQIKDYKICIAIGDYPFRFYYCCKECASSENQVKELINERKLKRPKSAFRNK